MELDVVMLNGMMLHLPKFLSDLIGNWRDEVWRLHTEEIAPP
jgi:hypothetical protein